MTTITKSKRYVEATMDPPHAAEGLTLTVWPDKGDEDSGSRRFRLLLEGAYAIRCAQAHIHPLAIREQSSQWVGDDPEDAAHADVLAAYEQDPEAAERVINRMLGWALDGWSPPCQPQSPQG